MLRQRCLTGRKALTKWTRQTAWLMISAGKQWFLERLVDGGFMRRLRHTGPNPYRLLNTLTAPTGVL